MPFRNTMPFRLCLVLAPLCLPGACHSGGPDGANIPGDSGVSEPYDGVRADEVLHFTGTEPFWGGQVSGATLTYTTPEKPDGTVIPIVRFNGRNGLGFSGTLDGAIFQMAVTPGDCRDGMSDRIYPLTVTLLIADQARNGCAWSASQPFAGPDKP